MLNHPGASLSEWQASVGFMLYINYLTYSVVPEFEHQVACS